MQNLKCSRGIIWWAENVSDGIKMKIDQCKIFDEFLQKELTRTSRNDVGNKMEWFPVFIHFIQDISVT